MVRTPIAFEPNVGQFDPAVRFASRGQGYTLFVTDTEALIQLRVAPARRQTLRVAFTGAAVRRPEASGPLPGTVNYLIGRDPARWRTGITTFERLEVEDVYPGIDLVYYGREGRHEYDLIVAPGADPSPIAMRVEGADRIALDDDGQLAITTRDATLTVKAPAVYQDIEGVRRTIDAHFRLADSGTVAFDLAAYDARAPLVIDPQIVYGSFLGGSGGGLDEANGVALDAADNVYIVGSTETSDFPVRDPLPSNSRLRGFSDAVVTKLSPDGRLIYSTYLGGDDYDYGIDIAVRADGTAYIVGHTSSTDFPVRNAFQPRLRGAVNAYIAELNPDGTSVVRATYLGGGDVDTAVAIQLNRTSDADRTGDVLGDTLFVLGGTSSPDFPARGALSRATRSGEYDSFLTVFDRTTLEPVFSSYVGGPGDDTPRQLLLDYRGDVYVLVHDSDRGFAAGHFVVQGAPTGSERLRPQLEAFIVIQSFFSDVLEEGDDASDKEVYEYFALLRGSIRPRAGRAPTNVSAAVPDAASLARIASRCKPVAPSRSCTERASIQFFDRNLRYLTHTNFGGTTSGRTLVSTMSALDQDGRVHVIGHTSDTALPVHNPVQGSHAGSSEGFVMTIDPASAEVLFLTYLGGREQDRLTDLAVDSSGNRWIVGVTNSRDFPVTRSGTQPDLRGMGDGFIVKITP